MKEFQTNVMWDLNLTDIFCVNSQYAFPLEIQGLVYQANYLVSGTPTDVNGKYVPGARVYNLVDGHWYRNSGTTASCSFVQVI